MGCMVIADIKPHIAADFHVDITTTITTTDYINS